MRSNEAVTFLSFLSLIIIKDAYGAALPPDPSSSSSIIFPGMPSYRDPSGRPSRPRPSSSPICFKFSVVTSDVDVTVGECVPLARCGSNDTRGSGRCAPTEVCCLDEFVIKEITTTVSPSTTSEHPRLLANLQVLQQKQQLVEDCGRAEWDTTLLEKSTSLSRRRRSGINLFNIPGLNINPGKDILATLRLPDMVQGPPDLKSEVAGGKDVETSEKLPVGRWPWMALLGYDEDATIKWKCGGSVLSSTIVLTAAHCVLHVRNHPENLTVRLGEYDISTEKDGPGKHTDFDVSRIIIHDGYLGSQNDIALLHLATTAVFGPRIRPVCLPAAHSDHTGKLVDLAGWGRLQFGGLTSDILQEVTVEVVDEESCEAVYLALGDTCTMKFPGGFEGTKVCAKGEGGTSRDACQGDSGGPLVVQDDDGRYQVIGIVSTGNGCGNPKFPGIYTKVSKYIPWIISNS